MLLGQLFLLTACAESIGSIEPPVLVDPPASLVVKCSRPVILPNRELSQSEVEKLWISDRSNLLACGERHESLVEFYKIRDGGVMGNGR
jgi:hypothetical protein